uniref:Uncharacterized protein n=1 Tax=Arundo donax TaxID=35708 RepID=A0A0A8YBG8_ARUDO
MYQIKHNFFLLDIEMLDLPINFGCAAAADTTAVPA